MEKNCVWCNFLQVLVTVTQQCQNIKGKITQYKNYFQISILYSLKINRKAFIKFRSQT